MSVILVRPGPFQQKKLSLSVCVAIVSRFNVQAIQQMKNDKTSSSESEVALSQPMGHFRLTHGNRAFLIFPFYLLIIDSRNRRLFLNPFSAPFSCNSAYCSGTAMVRVIRPSFFVDSNTNTVLLRCTNMSHRSEAHLTPTSAGPGVCVCLRWYSNFERKAGEGRHVLDLSVY